MNPLGINLWNWCAGLSEECLGLPEKVARMGFTAVELPMTQPQVPSALADEIRNTGLAVSLCAALGPAGIFPALTPPCAHPQWII